MQHISLKFQIKQTTNTAATDNEGLENPAQDECDKREHERRIVAELVGRLVGVVPGAVLAKDDDRSVDEDAELQDRSQNASGESQHEAHGASDHEKERNLGELAQVWILVEDSDDDHRHVDSDRGSNGKIKIRKVDHDAQSGWQQNLTCPKILKSF